MRRLFLASPIATQSVLGQTQGRPRADPARPPISTKAEPYVLARLRYAFSQADSATVATWLQLAFLKGKLQNPLPRGTTVGFAKPGPVGIFRTYWTVLSFVMQLRPGPRTFDDPAGGGDKLGGVLGTGTKYVPEK